MKTAEEIFHNIVETNDGLIFSQIPKPVKDFSISAMKEYAKQVAEQALKDAAENATASLTYSSPLDDPYAEYVDGCEVDEDSILDTEIKLP